MLYDWPLGNFETWQRGKYHNAILASGFDLLIRDQKFDANGNLLSEPGCSLWSDVLQGNLSLFWSLVE